MTTATAPYRLWRSAPYLTWLAGDTGTGLARTLAAFAIPLLALIATGDPAQAGIIGAVGMVVRLVATLAGGVLADRHRRLALMAIGGLVGVVIGGGFTLLAAADALTFGVLAVVAVLLSLRGGLFEVAGESALKQLVPEEAMGRAQAANQGRDAALSLIGAPLGGALLAVGGWTVGVVMTVCQLVAAGAAAVLLRGHRGVLPGEPAPAPEVAPAPVRSSAVAELREAFAWLFSRADLRGVLLVATVINLGFNAALTTVIYGMQQHGVSTVEIGWVSAAGGAAMLVGAIAGPPLVTRVPAGVLVVGGLAMTVAGAAALTLVHTPLAIAAVLAASVLLLPALNAGLMGYFMVAVPSALLGRANSAAAVLSMGAMPLAPLIAGFGLAWAGRTATVLACAAVCVVALAMAAGNRALRALPAEQGWAQHAARFAEGAA